MRPQSIGGDQGGVEEVGVVLTQNAVQVSLAS